MSTRFARMFARTGAQFLVREFGDTVTYRPLGGAARVVSAIIEREEVRFVSVGEVPVQTITVSVKDDSVFGIATTEIDTGGDQIDLPLRVGETAVTRTITRVISTENGMVTFAVE